MWGNKDTSELRPSWSDGTRITRLSVIANLGRTFLVVHMPTRRAELVTGQRQSLADGSISSLSGGEYRSMVADTWTRLRDDEKTAATPSVSPHHNKQKLFSELLNIIENWPGNKDK